MSQLSKSGIGMYARHFHLDSLWDFGDWEGNSAIESSRISEKFFLQNP
ncbi:MAG: hypothetical protein ACRCT1_07510 [Microcoleaceae cyanobacterium]